VYFFIFLFFFFKHLEKEHRAGIQEEGADVETAGEDGSGQMRVETIHQWPMFREEYKGLTNSNKMWKK